MTLSLKAKTIIPVALILVTITALVAIYNYMSQVALLNAEAEDSLKSTLRAGQSIIDGQLAFYQQMATLVAKMPVAADALAKGDRGRLVSEFSEGYEALKKEFNVAQFQFHKPPAISFLRLHMLEKYGDDLSAFRNTVLSVNEKKTGVRGVEVGRGGIGLRGVVPVFNRGVHAGSVEFGGNLTPAVDDAKRVFGVEAGVLLSRESTALVWEGLPKDVKMIGEFASFYSTQAGIAEGVLSAEILKETRRKPDKPFIGSAYHSGREYFLGIAPLKDYAGKDIGYFYVLKDKTEILGKIRKALLVNVAIYLAVLIIISFAINLSLKRTVIDPVIALTEAAESVSMGKLSQKIEVKTKDEISALAKSIDRMRVSMKKLLE
ncbi:MAG: cache domain-containing protein [Chloroflexota bacterium]